MAQAVETRPLVLEATRRAGGVHWLAAGVVAILLATVLARVWHLGNLPGVNGDEAWSGVQAARLVQGKPIAWRTPTGNPVNVFFLFPLAALHAVFSPSFTLLRTVAVASGLAALLANYLLCRRVYDTLTAVVSTLVLAVLPINIAYSRFAWDSSQSLLATLLVLYLPLIHYRRADCAEKLPVAAMVALAAAIWVHPTNIFAAPLVVVPIVYARREALAVAVRKLAVPERTWTLVVLVAVAAAVGYVGWRALAHVATHGEEQDPLLAFLRNYVGLFSGATVYQYLCGVGTRVGDTLVLGWLSPACNLLFLAFAVLGGIGLACRRDNDGRDVCLLAGWFVMLVGFFVVAGPSAIAPHFERYGICLVAPGALVLARGLAYWIEPERRRARAAAWGLMLAACLVLLTFYLTYFAFIEQTGGNAHRAFRTAAVEPKAAAYRMIAQERSAGEACIVADAWWVYWPLAYLASTDETVRVVSREPFAAAMAPPEESRGEPSWWRVQFVDAVVPERNSKAQQESTAAPARRVLVDYGGRPLLSVEGPEKQGFAN